MLTLRIGNVKDENHRIFHVTKTSNIQLFILLTRLLGIQEQTFPVYGRVTINVSGVMMGLLLNSAITLDVIYSYIIEISNTRSQFSF